MGFECAIYRTPKFKDTTLKELQNIENYYSWKNNPWNFEDDHYPEYKKYWIAMHSFENENEYPGEPDSEKYDFYAKILKKVEQKEGWSHYEMVNSWCSIGRNIDEIMVCVLPKVNEFTYGEFNTETFEELVKIAEARREESKLIPVQVNRAFIIDEEGNEKVIRISGILVENDEGWEKRIYTTDPEWGDETIYIPGKCADDDKRIVYESFADTLNSLKNIDFEKEFVWYERDY